MGVEKVADRDRSPAGQLYSQKPYYPVTCSHIQVAIFRADDGSRRLLSVSIECPCLPNAHRDPSQLGKGDGFGIERPDRSLKLDGGLGPIQSRLGSLDLGGIGREALILGGSLDPAGEDGVKVGSQTFRPEARQTVVQRLGGVLRINGAAYLAQYRPCVEAWVHSHERDPALPVSGEDRSLDRSRPAPAGEQRGMDIDAAQAGDLECRGRQ